MTITADASYQEQSAVGLFRRGFIAMLPLWAGAIPFGIAYSVTAREAGMSALDVQLMSLTVFAAAAQISTVALLDLGASTTEILITAVGLNIHLPLFGAAVAREVHLTPASRLATAFILTDATFAVSVAQGTLKLPILLGAGLSMYLGWNTGTALGLLAGGALPDAQRYAIDFVVPLTFLAVVVPLIRSKVALLVAACSVAGTLALAVWIPVGFAILIAGVASSLLGARMTGRRSLPGERACDA